MYRVTTTTKLSPEQVIEQAVKFFGPDGLGLRINDRDSTGARFEANLGFVAVDASPKGKGSSVDFITEELEYDVKKFIGRLPRSGGRKPTAKAEEQRL